MSPMAGAKFLIGVLVVAAVLYAVWLLLSMLPLPYPFPTVILIILALVALAYLLNYTSLWKGPGGPPE